MDRHLQRHVDHAIATLPPGSIPTLNELYERVRHELAEDRRYYRGPLPSWPRDDSAGYRASMREAGRGHLVR